MAIRPLVFVAMPFGTKPDSLRVHSIDFDKIYENGIKPALKGLDAYLIRADEERNGGMIHVPMFARLLLAEIAIVDVTIDNANVFYELGVRHTAKPRSTIIITAKDGPLPFDIANLKAIRYYLENGELTEDNAAKLIDALKTRVEHALRFDAEDRDSPLFQLFANYPGVQVKDADVDPDFKERAALVESTRGQLGTARRLGKEHGPPAIRALEGSVCSPAGVEGELVLDVILAYRALQAFEDLIAFVEKLPGEFRRKSVPVREQLALALNKRNRPGDREQAIEILQRVASERTDTSPETAGLMGSVYKGLHDDALADGKKLLAQGHLREAISWYRRGFQADPRDYYPGVNLLNLLLIEGSAKSLEEFRRTLPAVAFAVDRQQGIASADYWVVATALELAILGNDWATAQDAIPNMVMLSKDDAFALQSTLGNLKRLRDRKVAGIDTAAFDELLEMIGEYVTT